MSTLQLFLCLKSPADTSVLIEGDAYWCKPEDDNARTVWRVYYEPDNYESYPSGIFTQFFSTGNLSCECDSDDTTGWTREAYSVVKECNICGRPCN